MSRGDHEKNRLVQQKCLVILNNLLREEDNKYCVDCDAKGPRWASWNLGVFLCIRCAGIHRNLGVHISKVKSVNLDMWTPEQVACLQQMGNSQARAVYEANLPDNFRRPQIDPGLEAFIRAKYEQKKYIAKEWVPPPPPKPAFDIEEEKRKEKERKKSRNKVGGNVEIPTLPQHPTALPRPHSTGPHSPSPRAVQDTAKNVVQVPGSEDLLNLGDINTVEKDDTVFDAFITAPSVTGSSAPSTPAVGQENERVNGNKSADEADFFNQMGAGDTSQNSKMTKESILSLYGANACQMPATQPLPQVYGIPGGVYVGQQAYAQVAMPGYPPSNQVINVNNPGPNVSAMYNPFASIGSSTVPRQDTRLPPNTWLGIQPAAGVDPMLMTNNLGQVQQQMANLQLSGQSWNVGVPPVNATGMTVGNAQGGAGIMWPTAHGQSVSTNLWQ